VILNASKLLLIFLRFMLSWKTCNQTSSIITAHPTDICRGQAKTTKAGMGCGQSPMGCFPLEQQGLPKGKGLGSSRINKGRGSIGNYSWNMGEQLPAHSEQTTTVSLTAIDIGQLGPSMLRQILKGCCQIR